VAAYRLVQRLQQRALRVQPRAGFDDAPGALRPPLGVELLQHPVPIEPGRGLGQRVKQGVGVE